MKPLDSTNMDRKLSRFTLVYCMFLEYYFALGFSFEHQDLAQTLRVFLVRTVPRGMAIIGY